jgi:hypothetical protein
MVRGREGGQCLKFVELEVQIEHNKTQFKNFGDRSVNSPRHLYLPLETTPKTP